LLTFIFINCVLNAFHYSHSLGAAEALLAGMDLYQRVSTLNSENLSIYTVGCPRVGDPNFAYYVDSTGIPFSRSVNNRDIVPHVPPEDFGFLHPGVEAWDRTFTDVRTYRIIDISMLRINC
jgi:predicted lipase